MPTVSIIMPAYNSELFIGEAIRSVLQQTYKDYELLIVDDGSTDSTRSIVEGYCDKHPERIKYFFTGNEGASAARNHAITKAAGRFIAFLDSDDIWIPNKLEIQIECFNENKNIDLLYTNALYIDSSGKDLGDRLYARKEEMQYKPDEMFDHLLLRNFIPMSSIIIRCEVVNKAGLFDGSFRNTEDIDWLLRVVRRHSACGINSSLIKYRLHATNSSKEFDIVHRSSIEVIKKNITLYPEVVKKLGGKLSRVLSKKHYDCGYALFEKNDFKEARNNFLCSIKYRLFFRMRKYIYLLATFLSRNAVDRIRSIVRRHYNHES